MHWVDAEWPEPLKKALCKLWDNYAEAKEGRVNDSLDFMEQRWKFEDEIEKLQMNLKNLQVEVEKVVEEKQVALTLKAEAEQGLLVARAELENRKRMDATTSNMHEVMRIKVEKERDQLKEEKRKLEHVMKDLFDRKEAYRGKLKEIKELCDE